MATTNFNEATQTTFAGHETSFSLAEAQTVAALVGVAVEAVSGVIGGEWAGNGWWQVQPISFVNGKLVFPSCISNQSHRILSLRFNPDTGKLGAVCQITDSRGRLLNGERKLAKDEDGQTRRASGGHKEFVNGRWVITGPVRCDGVSKAFVERCMA